MHSLGINGEGELSGQPANTGSPEKWPLKWSVCGKVMPESDMGMVFLRHSA